MLLKDIQEVVNRIIASTEELVVLCQSISSYINQSNSLLEQINFVVGQLTLTRKVINIESARNALELLENSLTTTKELVSTSVMIALRPTVIIDKPGRFFGAPSKRVNFSR